MKKSVRILLLMISLIGLGISAGISSLFHPVPFITYGVEKCLDFFPWLSGVFAGYGVFICLCFFALLLAALFFPGKSSGIHFVKSGGKLQFSKQAVESAVRYSFADMDGINFSKVRARLNGQPDKTEIYVQLSLYDPSRLAELTETVQNKIESSLKSSLGITAKSVNIKVTELNPAYRDRRENREEQVGRVI